MENQSHLPDQAPVKGAAKPGEPLDVAALTRRMVEGEDQAYRQFHDAYVDRISRYLLVVTAGNEDLMREAVQRTLMRVVRHIRVFHREEVFWSWLTVLARSAMADESRQRRRYFAFLDRFAWQQNAGEVAPTGEGNAERLRELLDRNLGALPADERELLERKYIQHQSVSAIAALEQVSEKAVESRLTRVRQKLKKAMLAALHHDARA